MKKLLANGFITREADVIAPSVEKMSRFQTVTITERRLLKSASESLRPGHFMPEALDCNTHLKHSREPPRTRSLRGYTGWQES